MGNWAWDPAFNKLPRNVNIAGPLTGILSCLGNRFDLQFGQFCIEKSSSPSLQSLFLLSTNPDIILSDQIRVDEK